MREFGVIFEKQLWKGLRAYTTPRRNADLGLVECFNLMPSEGSLRGHDPVVDLGFAVPTVEFIAIKDQSGTIWYWLGGADLGAVFSTTSPNLSAYGYTALAVTPTSIPYWLQVDAIDAPATQMYIFPAEINGDLLVATTPPAIGSGYDIGAGLALRSMSGWKHVLCAISTQDTFWYQLGR